MDNTTNRTLEERLNNNEFSSLINYLEEYELFLIEFKKAKNWSYVFEVCYSNDIPDFITCNICSEKFPITHFKQHIKSTLHLNSLKTVTQFFHPVYTYCKRSEKLANGESVSLSYLQSGIADAKLELDKISKTAITEALQMDKILSHTSQNKEKDEYDLILEGLILKTDIKSPHQIYAEVKLPMDFLLQLEFQTKNKDWNRMLTSNNPHPSGRFFCVICSKVCTGILTVNSHFRGNTHKLNQLSLTLVRVPHYPHLTKNCIYSYDAHYSVIVKHYARGIFNDQVQEIIKRGDGTKFIKELYGPKDDNKPLLTSVAAKAEILKGKFPKKSYQTKSANKLPKNIDNEGLIGVEYVVKLLKNASDESPMFECCLCEVVLNESRMLGHLINYNHRLKYCEAHYPDTIKKYKDLIGKVKYAVFYSIMGFILSKIAVEIEKHHGRLIPSTVSWVKFANNRKEIVAKLFGMRHACQQHGPSFSNIVTNEDIVDMKTKDIAYEQPIVPQHYESRLNTMDMKKLYVGQRPLEFSKWNVDHDSSQMKINVESQNLSKRNNNSHSPSIEKNKDLTYNLDHQYEKYRRNPESHPLYAEEWSQFWKNRKNELIADGIDHRSYNYQPDWVCFFKSRLEELYKDDLRNVLELRKVRSLSRKSTEEHLTLEGNTKREIKKRKSSDHLKGPEEIIRCFHKSDNNARSPQFQNEIIDVDFNDTVVKHNDLSFRSPPKNYNDSNNLAPKQNDSRVRDDKPNVIHVLRLLTALEDHLGSLGAKVMDLLSKALVFEKKYDNKELEKNILTGDSCTLLETGMEKLKGILFAGLLEQSKIIGFERVIQHTQDLLDYADKMGYRTLEDTNKVSDWNSLIKEIQSKADFLQKNSTKSLSDTLKDIISMQKKDSNYDSRESSTLYSDSNCRSIVNDSNVNTESNYNSINQNETLRKRDNITLTRKIFNNQKLSPIVASENNYGQFSNMGNFDNQFNRNVQPYERSDKNLFRNLSDGVSNTMGFNNTQMSRSAINNINNKTMLGNEVGENIPNGLLQPNQSHLVNDHWTGNNFQSAFNDTTKSKNWKESSNNEMWGTNQQFSNWRNQ